MKLFISKLLIFFSILGLATVAINLSAKKTRSASDYMSAIIDKHNRAQQIKCPKIIIAGASNAAFGINSEKIEKTFNIPVVNMSLHGGLGLSFILEELKTTMRKGDLVLLSIEYFLSKDGDYRLKKNTSSYFREAESYYSSNLYNDLSIYLERTNLNLKSLFRIGSDTSGTGSGEAGIPVYSRRAFNKYGDVVAHLGRKSPKKVDFDEILTYRYWEGISEINQFGDYAKKMGVKVFFLYPNFSSTEYSLNRLAISQLQKDIDKEMRVEILNTPTDLLFPDSLFFDTVYHLDSTGREERTDRLIELLKSSASVQRWMNGM
jgi:hypothetical protein